MGEAVALRLLVPGDEQRLFSFLEHHVDTSLFLFSNVERGGLVYRGEALQGTYVARFDATGAITAVASHTWNGNIMLQGDVGLEEAAVRVAAESGRSVRGLIGPWSLVCRARRALGLEQTKANHDAQELLFALPLDALTLPTMLERQELLVRPPTALELRETLVRWRVDYMVESLGAQPSPDLEESAFQNIDGARNSGLLWVLTHGGELVAMTAFNASTRGIVQVGGVYTPPHWRNRGYARAAVAGSLLQARENGATRSVLFTAEHNQAARRCYTALGYQVIGDFGLVLF